MEARAVFMEGLRLGPRAVVGPDEISLAGIAESVLAPTASAGHDPCAISTPITAFLSMTGAAMKAIGAPPEGA